MKLNHICDETILDIFPVAIEYGDETGLEGDEAEMLASWLQAMNDLRAHNGQLVFSYGESEEFAVCDVTGLRGNCITVTVCELY